MTTASITSTPTGRAEYPDQFSSAEPKNRNFNDEKTAWNAGISDKKTTPTPSEKGHADDPADTRISLTRAGHDSPMTPEEVIAELNAARGAAGQMNPQGSVSATTNTVGGTDTVALSHCCESVYRNSCIAGSVILFLLSIASFIAPSVSNYAEERGTVQALGYTAGTLSLLASLGIAYCVWSIYEKPDNDFRR